MKLTSTIDPVVSTLPNQAVQFKIATSAKAFSILMDKMYQNKVRAVIRELCSNAQDAHIAAGCADRPFEVTLPTTFDPHFTVRDYGVSMEHDTVMDLYATFFGSDKDNSNDFTGGLGIGSKVPFAICDTFVVTTYNHNYDALSSARTVKRTYVVFLDQHVPTITLAATEYSEEERGVEVKVRVKPSDMNQFRQELDVFDAFQVQPLVDGVQKTVPASKFSGSSGEYRWEILPSTWNHSKGSFVQQGCVRYPIPYSITTPGAVPSGNLILHVPMGSVDITPSREHLEDTDRTRMAVRFVLDIAATQMAAQYEAEMAAIEKLPQLQRAQRYIEAKLTFHGSSLVYNDQRHWQYIRLGKGGSPVQYTQNGLRQEVREFLYPVKIDLYYIPDPSKRGVAGRLRRNGATYFVTDIREQQRLKRVLGLSNSQLKTVDDLVAPLPSTARAKNTGPKLSHFYTLDGDRIPEDEVKEDYYWVIINKSWRGDTFKTNVTPMNTVYDYWTMSGVAKQFTDMVGKPVYAVSATYSARMDPDKAFNFGMMKFHPNYMLQWYSEMLNTLHWNIGVDSRYAALVLKAYALPSTGKTFVDSHAVYGTSANTEFLRLQEAIKADVKARFPRLFPMTQQEIIQYINDNKGH